MKFLCDQCKAKYQISDDKVAGKTVRMKCRKCGHMIEVRAAVTETSVASGTPSEPPPALLGGAGPSAPPRPPPKPSTVPKSSLATSLSSAKPQPPRPLSQRPDAGLAGAFNKQIQKEEDPGLLEIATTDEWYAAINGVPVGPIRIAELRRKAALGAVTDDSLVWQEGMEEWRPVKTIPELQKIMQEAATSGRVSSLATPEPPPARSVPPSPAAPSMRPQKPTSPPRPAPPARSNVVPITSRLATAEKLEEAPPLPHEKKQLGSGSPEGLTSERLSLAPDPFAMGAPAPTMGTPAPSAMASLAAPAPIAASAVAAPAAPIVIQQKGPPPVIAIGVILALMAFGGVAAYAIFFKPAPAPEKEVVHDVVHDTVYVPAPSASGDNSAAAPSAQAKVASRGTGPKAAVSAAPSARVDVSSLLGGGTGPSGPQLMFGGGTGPSTGGGPGPSAGGGNLTEDQITSVLNMHKLGIRRTCLEKSNSGVANPKVTVHVKVAGDGSVSSAISDGNDPTTGKCLENEIAKWHFPSGPGAFDAPFSIVRQ